MSNEKQMELREILLGEIMAYLVNDQVTVEQALAAAFGATATILGTYPPATRKVVAEQLKAQLLTTANERARQLRDGSVDRQQARLRA